MQGQAFLIGCLLKQADRLHRQYCIEVRNKGDKNKSLPTQLMGNAVFQIALDNPVEGLNRLEEKMRIYLGWAETANSSKARLVLTDIEKAAQSLARTSETLPKQFSSEERAQMLLGYLAGFPDDSCGENADEADNDSEREIKQDKEDDHE